MPLGLYSGGLPDSGSPKIGGWGAIHNFHLTRPDGTTAAERLFDHEFPDLFEWVVEHMGDLPLARQSKKTQRPNSSHLEGFPV